MSKRDNIHRHDRAALPEILSKPLESDNVCNVDLSDLEYRSGRICRGCGQWFVPTGAQTFCEHACYAASLRVPIEQRFWPKVNKHGPVPAHVPELGGCWLWTAATIRGYGQIIGWLNGKKRPLYAHRLSWEFAHGPILHDLEVLHRCDEPLCVNPDHLFLGTQQDNLNDARRKGRLRGRESAIAPVFERVPHVDLPIRGDLHVGDDARAGSVPLANSVAERFA